MRETITLEIDTTTLSQGTGSNSLNAQAPTGTVGFTAVNLETLSKSHLPPLNERSQPSTTGMTYSTLTGTHDIPSQPGWRAADRTDSVLQPEPSYEQSRDSAKRKHVEIDSHVEPSREVPSIEDRPSPKRRMIMHEDVAARSVEDRQTTEATNGDSSSVTRGDIAPTSREPTPVPTWNQRQPLPQVRPETEANMAESLATHLHSIDQSTPSRDSPEDNETNHHSAPRSSEYSPDVYGDSSNNKRKRNFSNRTKSGCLTCRSRKKKCDETKPACANCVRGNFTCAGYGGKASNSKAVTQARPLQIQAKQVETAQPAHFADGPRYDHWGRTTAPPAAPPSSTAQHRPPPGPISPESARAPYQRDHWRPGGPSTWPHGLQPPVNLPPTLPPVDFNQLPTPISGYPYDAVPPQEPWQHQPLPYYGPHTGAGTTVSSRESVGTSSSQRALHLSNLSFAIPGQRSEKEKMLLGKPYLHFIDDVLLDDRQQCKAAVERYNNAARPSDGISADERSRFFSAVIDPAKRPISNQKYHGVPANSPTLIRPGRIGYRTIVETPFNCDFGYNINLGDDIVIGAGCYMQDPCEIIIGNRTIVGPNVKFYGLTASVDAGSRNGSQGRLSGGAIIVEEDCFIGGDVTILPHRVIGKGAVVGAGSVVTKNVPPYTVVAGNPAREIRTLGPGSVEDRRMRTLIQSENEASVKAMMERRQVRD
ncbi:hypothetical protein LTR95_002212 [Oleoguttula sp. CCFEE 5521]